MKLLFDENRSPLLPRLVVEEYPLSQHVRDVGLAGADDTAPWHFASEGGYTFVTKDDDFIELSVLRGAPPKVVVLTLGNCRAAEIAELLKSRHVAMLQFSADPTASLLELP